VRTCFERTSEQISFGAEEDTPLEITGTTEDDAVADRSQSVGFLLCCCSLIGSEEVVFCVAQATTHPQ